jgi:2-polyprenylphenol 6-hydroxylase
MSTSPGIVIVGGGPVGLAFALACRPFGEVSVVDALPPLRAPLSESFDHRVYALSPGSRALLEKLGVWNAMPQVRIAPVNSMKVWGDERTAPLDLDGGYPVAWIVEHASLMSALDARIREAGIRLLAPATPKSLDHDAEGARLELADGSVLEGELLIGADGGNSWVRHQVGLGAQAKSYDSAGVIANFACDRPHQGCARQWFAQEGVLAWLPLPGKRMSMVWSVSAERAETLRALDPAALAQTVLEAGDGSLGKLTLISPVACPPLRRVISEHCWAPGVALIGDAAHVIHPLAGQGVNLGFGDVEVLADMLKNRGPLLRPGDTALLRQYERSRREKVLALATLTDRLKTLFEQPGSGWSTLRNRGLGLVERQGWLKREIMRYAMR